MKQTLIRYSSKYVESKLTRHGGNHSLKPWCIRHNSSDKTEISQQQQQQRGDKNEFKKCLGSSHKGKHKIQLEWGMRMEGGSSSNPIRSGAERGGEAGNGRDLIHIGIMAYSQAAACSRI